MQNAGAGSISAHMKPLQLRLIDTHELEIGRVEDRDKRKSLIGEENGF
jgi:hypothetical protein